MVVPKVCGKSQGMNQVMDTANSQIRILAVDDHALVRDGIAGLVGVQSDMVMVGEASNGREAIQQFRTAPSGRHADGLADAGDEWDRGAHCYSK